MRMVLLVIATGALLAGAAQAKESPNALAVGQDAVARQAATPGVKRLYVCDAEELSWRAFSRDLGTPEFVTADEVRTDSGKAWNAPRCITPSELRRLTSTVKVGYLSEIKLVPK